MPSNCNGDLGCRCSFSSNIQPASEQMAQISLSEIASAIADSVALLETPPKTPTSSFEDILKNRLFAYYSRHDANDTSRHLASISSQKEIELLTAKEALSIIRRVQKILDVELDESLQEPPPLGTRDLAKLRTLLSLVFKWGVEPLYVRVSGGWPESIMAGGAHPKIIDLTSDSDDYGILTELTSSIVALVFPQGVQGRISQTLITTSILSRHIADVLLPSIALGWLPESLSSSSAPILHELRPLVMRLLKL